MEDLCRIDDLVNVLKIVRSLQEEERSVRSSGLPMCRVQHLLDKSETLPWCL